MIVRLFALLGKKMKLLSTAEKGGNPLALCTWKVGKFCLAMLIFNFTAGLPSGFQVLESCEIVALVLH